MTFNLTGEMRAALADRYRIERELGAGGCLARTLHGRAVLNLEPWRRPQRSQETQRMATIQTDKLTRSLTTLFSELVDGAKAPLGGNFILNSGDAGMLASLDKLSAAEASASVHGGATIAAHAQHTRYGLILFNRWASEGGNPFADAKWDEAWKTSAVSDEQWADICAGLRDEAHRWLQVLGTARDVRTLELTGMIGEIVHVAYHLGAMRQIATNARGPRDGTFA